MDGNRYQKLAARTLIDRPEMPISGEEIMLGWNALGLVGECGEIADAIKKAVFHRHGISPFEKAELKKELGDVLWYVAALCSGLGFELGEIMEINVLKLEQRYPAGFSSKASRERKV